MLRTSAGPSGIPAVDPGNAAYAPFFFQAEDGIRDRTVTGVQTCALPIWTRTCRRRRRPHAAARARRMVGGSSSLSLVGARSEGGVQPRSEPVEEGGIDRVRERSEERRVGKGWRRGWWLTRHGTNELRHVL